MTPDTELTKTGGSGSDNYHSRLAPSAAKRWLKCTASVKFIEDNYDLILPVKLGKVVKLTPYLKSIPDEELKDHERRAMVIAEDVSTGRRDISSLTDEEKWDIEKSEGSVASRTGVRAHDFAEAILNGRKTLDDIPKEFREPLKIYIDHCLSLVPEGVRPLIEEKVSLYYSENPDDTGTTDFAVLTNDAIHVRDYKNGGGEEEVAEHNLQMVIYSLSLIGMYDWDFDFRPDTVVTLGIIQPNHHAGNPVKVWETTLAELQAFGRDIHHSAIQIRLGKVTKFAPSHSTCMWCDAKNWCPARNAMPDEETNVSKFDMLSLLPDLDAIPVEVDEVIQDINELVSPVPANEQFLLALWKNKKNITKLLADAEEYFELKALAGTPVEGTKLVMGNLGDRAWSDPDAAEVFLRGQKLKEAQRFNQKLISPAQAEKLLNLKKLPKRTQSRFAELVSRSPARPVLALASDKRQAIESSVNLLPDLDEDADV